MLTVKNQILGIESPPYGKNMVKDLKELLPCNYEEWLSANFWWTLDFDTIGLYFSQNRATSTANRGLLFIRNDWLSEEWKFKSNKEAAKAFGLLSLGRWHR